MFVCLALAAVALALGALLLLREVRGTAPGAQPAPAAQVYLQEELRVDTGCAVAVGRLALRQREKQLFALLMRKLDAAGLSRREVHAILDGRPAPGAARSAEAAVPAPRLPAAAPAPGPPPAEPTLVTNVFTTGSELAQVPGGCAHPAGVVPAAGTANWMQLDAAATRRLLLSSGVPL